MTNYDRYEKFRNILQAEFLKRTQKNSSYSLRALARDLGVSVATLSGVLGSKRKPSLRTAEKIITALGLSKKEAESALSCWNEPEFTAVGDKIDATMLYDQLFLTFAILSFIETTEYTGQVEEIAKKFELKKKYTVELLDQLCEIGMIRKARGRYVATGEKYTLGDDKIQSALRVLSLNSLSHTKAFIENAPDKFRFEKSDLSIMFIPADTEKLIEAKKKIQRFRRSLAKFLDSGERQRAYMLAINLLPLGKI